MRNVSLWLPDEVVEEIDRRRGDVPRGRWIKRLIERALKEAVT